MPKKTVKKKEKKMFSCVKTKYKYKLTYFEFIEIVWLLLSNFYFLAESKRNIVNQKHAVHETRPLTLVQIHLRVHGTVHDR